MQKGDRTIYSFSEHLFKDLIPPIGGVFKLNPYLNNNLIIKCSVT